MTIKEINLVSTADIGAALYCIAPESNVDNSIGDDLVGNSLASKTYLLGIGLWDRANSPHTSGIKDATKGQVIRIDETNDLISASEELSNIIYQLLPLDDGRIFVGCRNGDLMYLNKDLSINKHIELENKGLYFYVRDKDTIIATMREGSVLFYDLLTETSKILPVVDKDIRMWPILKDENRILAGSYKGHLAEIVDRELISIKKLPENNSAIWTIDKFNGKYMIGTASGILWSLDENLENPTKIFKSETGVTYMIHLNGEQLAFGNVHGDIHILNKDYSTIAHTHTGNEKIANTIWSMDYDSSSSLMRVGYSNGQIRTFTLR